MKMSSLLFALPLMLLLTGCFKTAEQIKREEMVDSMAVQMVDNQKITANVGLKIQSLEERLAALSGEVETTGHSVKSTSEERFKSIEADIKIFKDNFNELDEDFQELKKTVLEQKQYLEEVLKVLGEISNKGSKKAAAVKKTPYQEAVDYYRSSDYKSAKGALAQLVNKKSIKGNDLANAIYYLGMISFRDKDYGDALVYFSKLFTEHSSSPLNSSGLLHMGRSFSKMKQIDQARQAYETFLTKFPKSKYVDTVKKELAALK